MKFKKLITALSITSCFLSCTAKKQNNNENTSYWSLKVGLDLNKEEMHPPALMFAVFSNDPIPQFINRIKRMHNTYTKQFDNETDHNKRESLRITQIEATWEMGFYDIKGSDVYLLFPTSNLSQVVSANSPEGKKWVVTKWLYYQGKNICWAVPVDVGANKSINLMLTANNALDLDSLYIQAMND
jgi:hypothetical protein